MMQKLGDVWLWMDGKKTKLAGIFYLIYTEVLPIWFDPMPTVLDKTCHSIVKYLMYAGLLHAGAKAITGRPQ